VDENTLNRWRENNEDIELLLKYKKYKLYNKVFNIFKK